MLLFISYKQHKYYIWRKFQYITCYSLSHSENIHCMDVVLFQYITCYSLSAAGKTQAKMFPGFNTSHVTLYLHPHQSVHRRQKCFNTSHVTLYLRALFLRMGLYYRFNTSHVTLYLFAGNFIL